MTEAVIRVRKKGVTIIPKRLREAASIREDSEVKVKVLPAGLLLQSFTEDPVGKLESLSTADNTSSVASIRSLRRKIARQLRD